jgi:cytochrome c oxidase cbb3-type subunit 4
VDIGTARGLITATLLVAFLGIWIWSWSRRRQEEFKAASELPLGDDEKPPANENTKEQQS